MPRKSKNYTAFNLQVHIYDQKLLIFSSNTWIMRPDFLKGSSETEQCFSKKNILLINFPRPFYSDQISEKQMENNMSHIFPWWKSQPNPKSCEAIYPFHNICKIWRKLSLLLAKVMFIIFMRLKEVLCMQKSEFLSFLKNISAHDKTQ